MKQLFNSITNERLLKFTEELANTSAKSAATFSDLKITDYDKVIHEARKQAEEFALSRSVKGTHPRSTVGFSDDENRIRDDVKSWLARRTLRGRGPRDPK